MVTSCNKEEPVSLEDVYLTDDVELMNGALNFVSPDAFFSISEKLGSMSDEDRDVWEDKLGFISLRTELNNLYEELEEIEDAQVENNLLLLNSDILKIEEGNIIPVIESAAYASIVNRLGVFYVDGIIHKVDGGRIASSEDGSYATVSAALSSSSLKANQLGVQVVDYIIPNDNSSLKSSNCGTSKTAWYNSSDRKCDYIVKAIKYYCKGCCGNYYYQVKVENNVTNYKKTILKRWKKYNTITKIENVAFTISVPIVTGYNGKNSLFYYSDRTYNFASQTSKEVATYTLWALVGDKVENSDINTPVFNRVKGKATNRGLGYNKYAEINCGAW